MSIEKGNWKGIALEIGIAVLTFTMVLWQLWAIMSYQNNMYWSIASIVCLPIAYVLIQNLCGRKIKGIETDYMLEFKKLKNEHETEIKILADDVAKKAVENWQLKIDKANLEGQLAKKKD